MDITLISSEDLRERGRGRRICTQKLLTSFNMSGKEEKSWQRDISGNEDSKWNLLVIHVSERRQAELLVIHASRHQNSGHGQVFILYSVKTIQYRPVNKIIDFFMTQLIYP